MGWPIFLKQSTLLVCGNSSSLPQEPLGLLQRKKSLPDVADLVGVAAQQSSQEMTREEISVLSSARRDNVRRQMEEIERYKSNPLMYILNPRVQVSREAGRQTPPQDGDGLSFPDFCHLPQPAEESPLLAVTASCIAHLMGPAAASPPPRPPPVKDEGDGDQRQFDDLEID